MSQYKADIEIQYAIPGVYMDTNSAPDNLPVGACFRISGVDGRFSGSLHRFPGMKSVLDLDHGIDYNGSFLGVSFGAYRGFVHRTNPSSPFYFNNTTPDWGTANYSTNYASVTSHGDFAYLFAEDTTGSLFPKVVYDSSGLQVESLGPALLTGDPDAPSTASAGGHSATEGYLNFRGTYRVAVKYYHSTRQVYTGLSQIFTLTVDPSAVTGGVYSGNSYKWMLDISQAGLDSDYDKIEIYRTTNLNDPMDPYKAGIFFLESTVTRGTTADYWVGKMPDAALVLQKHYDPWMDPVQLPPLSGVCAYYQGSIFAAQSRYTNNGLGIVWTNPGRVRPEEFGSEYSYLGSPKDGRIHSLVVVGDTLWGFSASIAYRIIKNGGSVSVERMLEGRGPLHPGALVSVDRSVIMVTGEGLVIFSEGVAKLIPSASRILKEDWKDSLEYITMSYDSRMGCVFIQNGYLYETLCLWTSTMQISLLEATPFTRTTSLLDYGQDTDSIKAYFVTKDGRIVTPDHDFSGYGTMQGGVPDDNNITPSDSYNATLSSALGSNHIVYVTSGGDAGSWGVTDGASSITNITLNTNDVYSVDPVIFKVRLGPVRTGDYPIFSRKVLKSIGLKMSLPNDGYFTSLTTAQRQEVRTTFTVGAYRDTSGARSDSAQRFSDTITASMNPSDCVVHGSLDGTLVEPYIEQISGGFNFELTGVKVVGTMTVSENIA